MNETYQQELAHMAVIPDHVPSALVHECPLFSRRVVVENPYETMIPAIHRGPAIFYAPGSLPGGRGGWVVRRASDLLALYSDTDNFHKNGNTRFAKMLGEHWDVIPTELDPPRHTAFRSALNPIFSAARMATLDARVRQRARELIGRFRHRGHCDFISEFAVPFPISIFLDLLGLPQENMPIYLKWVEVLLHGSDEQQRISGVRVVKNLLMDAIEQRRTDPGDDLISQALGLEVDGRKWTDDEVLGYCFNLYIGGLDTVTTNMGLHFRHLAESPEQQASLREHTSLQSPAIEELLRAYAAVTTQRIVSRPIDFGGVRFMPGDFIAMSTPLAGRDPEEYDHPQSVDFNRQPRHLSFGRGRHHCLGQHLARRELQIAFQEFLSQIPSFRVASGAEVPFFVGSIVHVKRLPLEWH